MPREAWAMFEELMSAGAMLAASIVGGTGMGILGAYVVGMRIPFLAIVTSHAAMLGAVTACIIGWPILPTSFAAALVSVMLLGFLTQPGGRTEMNVHSSILFALFMGLTFIAMGMFRGDMTPILGFMWGSLLFVSEGDVAVMAILLICLGIFGAVFHREMKAIIFSRRLADLSGIRVRIINMVFLGLAAAIITAHIKIIGGILIYSLLSCPAAAAFETGRGFRAVLILSGLFGLAGALGGFLISWSANLPTGACITLCSVGIYGIVHVFNRVQRNV